MPFLDAPAKISTAKGQQDASVLLDTGSCNNYISYLMVKEWGLLLNYRPLVMKMVDGHKGLTYGTVTITLELEDSLR